VAILGSPILGALGLVKWDNVVSLIMAGGSSLFAAWILSKLSMAIRDRVLAIYVLMVFVVFFWGAFEQAGNAMNVWADQTTNRHLTETPPEPSLFPEKPVDVAEVGYWQIVKNAFKSLVKINPVLTTSFQSINAAAIVFFAPIFAWLWVFLARHHVRISIAVKMAMGVFLQGMAFALMIFSVQFENGSSTTKAVPLPYSVIKGEGGSLYFHDTPELTDDDKPLEGFLADKHKAEEPMIAHGGRLILAEEAGELRMRGVLNENHRDRILRSTAPKDYVEAIWKLAQRTKAAKKQAIEAGKDEFEVTATLETLPPGFEPRYLDGFKEKELTFDAETRTFTVTTALADKDYKQILVAGADPQFRNALNELYVASAKFKVSSWWLFWFYILCTLGELCLSPVGLSMVSKLAPRRFATMLMGMWLLTNFFGGFTAGLAGENWEKLDPGSYFLYVTLAMMVASLICFLFARKITRMMHGVN
jgi:POT family proton-dependent oligopeptide transporter